MGSSVAQTKRFCTVYYSEQCLVSHHQTLISLIILLYVEIRPSVACDLTYAIMDVVITVLCVANCSSVISSLVNDYVTQFKTIWHSHRQPVATLQGEDSSAPMLQRPNQAVALQDSAYCDIHSPLQGEPFSSDSYSIIALSLHLNFHLELNQKRFFCHI